MMKVFIFLLLISCVHSQRDYRIIQKIKGYDGTSQSLQRYQNNPAMDMQSRNHQIDDRLRSMQHGNSYPSPIYGNQYGNPLSPFKALLHKSFKKFQ